MTSHPTTLRANDLTGTPLDRASALPASFYTDPEIYRLEEALLFRREWISVGRIDQVAKPGDFFSVDVGGTPLLVVRGKDGEVRALSATCLHRFMPVAEGQGNRTSFQCPYHLWTYALDGQLIGAPHMEQAAGFDVADCRLPQASVEVWEGFIFVNLDATAAPLAPQIEPLRRTIAGYGIGDWRVAATMDYDSPWNWKITFENFAESYHHIGIHRDSLEPLFPAATTSHEDAGGPYIIHHLPTKDGVAFPTKFAAPPGISDLQRRELGVYAVLPIHMFTLQPDEMTYLQLIPISHERHLTRFYICWPPSAWDDPRFDEHLAQSKAAVDYIQQQDIGANAAVARGVRSVFAQGGRLSHLEKGVWQFDEWVKSKLAEAS